MISTQEPFKNLPVDLETLPRVDEIEYRSIAPQYFWTRLIGALIRLLWITLMYFIVAYALRESIPLWIRQIVPWLLLVWWVFSIFRVYKTYKKKAFAIRDRDIHYKSGWIWRRKTTIPFNRIQHCEVSSGPLQRMFDLCEVHVFTAGGSHSDLTIPGLTTDTGHRLKKFILEKIGSDEEE
ncbi:MAG: PH domain-containing protein [Saprospiraceae bacterium]|nr:PH domain-containing protein [Saprospiraceae bacterium]